MELIVALHPPKGKKKRKGNVTFNDYVTVLYGTRSWGFEHENIVEFVLLLHSSPGPGLQVRSLHQLSVDTYAILMWNYDDTVPIPCNFKVVRLSQHWDLSCCFNG